MESDTETKEWPLLFHFHILQRYSDFFQGDYETRPPANTTLLYPILLAFKALHFFFTEDLQVTAGNEIVTQLNAYSK